MARPRKVTDQQLDKTARQCILEFGPQVSTKVIAERVGISQPAVLKRFGSKRKLIIRALCPDGPPPWFEKLEEGPDLSSAIRPQLTAILVEAMDFFADLAPRLIMLRASGIELAEVFPTNQEAPPMQIRRLLAEWLSEVGEAENRDDVDYRAVSDTLLDAIEGRMFLAEIGGERFVEGHQDTDIERLLDVCWEALSPDSKRIDQGVSG